MTRKKRHSKQILHRKREDLRQRGICASRKAEKSMIQRNDYRKVFAYFALTVVALIILSFYFIK